MAIQKRGVNHPRLGFVGAEIFTNFCFFIHNFDSRYVRKPFKVSKDADFGLVSKQTWAKNGSMDWRPGPGKGGQKNAKTPPLVKSPPDIPRPKNKNKFFRSQLEGFLNPQGVWTALQL